VPARRLIDGYLEDLRAELKLPRRTRARVLAEVADHLHEAAERREGDGDEAVQRAAIDTFGSPRLVALRFSEELAVADARRGAVLTAVATVMFCAVVALIGPWRTDAIGRAFGAVSPFAAQVAVTCAGLSLLRAFRHRGERALGAGKLRWIMRGDAIALGSLLLSAMSGLAGAMLAAHPSQHSGILIGSAVAIVVSLPPLLTLVRGQARTRGLARFAEHQVPEGEDALADVLAVGAELRRWAMARSALAPLVARLDRISHAPAVRALTNWLHLRRHPWRAATALALLAGAAIGLGHGLSEGGLPGLSALPRAAAGFGILLAIEGAAVLICFAALGGYLGIRGSAIRPSH
jgi:hypothetical protein